MYNVQRQVVTTLCDFWGQILSSERIAGTTFQHLRAIPNLLEGSSEKLCCCVTGEGRDMENPGGFRPAKQLNLAVSKSFWQKFSSHPVPVFTKFKYCIIYSKMVFQEEITDAKVSTLLRMQTVNHRHCH